MRVATLFTRLLGPGRERVVGVEIVGQGEHQEVIVDLARRERRRMRGGRCDRVVRGSTAGAPAAGTTSISCACAAR